MAGASESPVSSTQRVVSLISIEVISHLFRPASPSRVEGTQEIGRADIEKDRCCRRSGSDCGGEECRAAVLHDRLSLLPVERVHTKETGPRSRNAQDALRSEALGFEETIGCET